MMIDSSKLMLKACLYARTSTPLTAVLLDMLPVALDLAQQNGTLAVHVQASIVNRLSPEIRQEIKVNWLARRCRDYTILAQARPFFALAHVGAHELKRLWDTGETAATRSLAYAFHKVPLFLSRPETFDPELYWHSFRIAARHWDVLSPAMQLQFCTLVRLDQNAIEAVLRREDIALADDNNDE